MFPILRTRKESVCEGQSNDVLGVVDVTGITKDDPTIASLLRNFSIPLVHASYHQVFPPRARAKVNLIFC